MTPTGLELTWSQPSNKKPSPYSLSKRRRLRPFDLISTIPISGCCSRYGSFDLSIECRDQPAVSGLFSTLDAPKRFRKMDHPIQQLPTVNVQAYYAGKHSRQIGLHACSALLTKLTTPQPLQFESSGRCHNFNFQISKAVQTDWKCGILSSRDVVAPGHVSLNAAQESFSCTVAPVVEAVSLHIELYPDWIFKV